MAAVTVVELRRLPLQADIASSVITADTMTSLPAVYPTSSRISFKTDRQAELTVVQKHHIFVQVVGLIIRLAERR